MHYLNLLHKAADYDMPFEIEGEIAQLQFNFSEDNSKVLSISTFECRKLE